METLSNEPGAYGSSLVPLINEKLPTVSKLLIAHRFDFDAWPLSKMLEYVKKEIEAKETATLNVLLFLKFLTRLRRIRYSLSVLITERKREN